MTTIALGLQALLAILAGADVLLDLDRPFIGSDIATGKAILLVALVAGAIRARHEVAGGRPMLVVADLAIAVVFGIDLQAWSGSYGPPAPMLQVAAIACAILAAAATTQLPRAPTGGVIRARRSLLIPLLIVIFDGWAIASVVGQAAGSGDREVVGVVLRSAASIVLTDVVFLVAWWWGAGWTLGVASASTLVVGLTFALRFGPAPQFGGTDLVGTLGVLLAPGFLASWTGLVGALVGPRLIGRETMPVGSDDRTRRPWVATTWLIVAALLWVPAVGYGLSPPISDVCLGCPPVVPLQDLLVGIDLVSLAFVPVTVAILVLRRRSGSIDSIFAGWLFAIGGIVIVEVGLGLAGSPRFWYLGGTAPVAVLLALGAGITLVRPASVARTGELAGLAAAAVTVIWAWSLMRGAGGLQDLIPGVAGLAVAACIAVGLAREGGRRSVRAEAARPIDPPTDPSTRRTDVDETGLDTGSDST
jgi:hypothetical protein